MQKPGRAFQFAATAAVALSLAASTAPMASAAPSGTGTKVDGKVTIQDWGGGSNKKRAVSIRQKPTTASKKVGTLKAGKTVECWVSNCSGGTHNGGTYKCTSKSPAEKDWHAVQWKGKKAYTASRCLNWGRVG